MTILEAPKEAARRLAAPAIKDGFQPQALHEYRSADGVPVFWRIRCKHADGRKWIRPIKRNGDGFAIGEPPAPEAGKLLYRLPELLAADPARPVWLPEGHTDHLQACPWCPHLLAGVSLPRPPVRCADCRHSESWPGNPEAACVNLKYRRLFTFA